MPEREHHVCPVWAGYLLNSPFRKLSQNPVKILSPYVRKGMWVADLGCAMGFFTLSLARMVGPEGKVIAVDIQKKMINRLMKRAQKAGLSDRIEARICPANTLDLKVFQHKIDFALASAVVHEVPDPSRFFTEICEILKTNGRLLVIEPKGHVSSESFGHSIDAAAQHGFTIHIKESPKIRKSWSVCLVREKFGSRRKR